jgi:hypothetical protein
MTLKGTFGVQSVNRAASDLIKKKEKQSCPCNQIKARLLYFNYSGDLLPGAMTYTV